MNPIYKYFFYICTKGGVPSWKVTILNAIKSTFTVALVVPGLSNRRRIVPLFVSTPVRKPDGSVSRFVMKYSLHFLEELTANPAVVVG